MQCLDAVLFEPRANAFTDIGRDRRHGGQAARQCLEVESGTAGENRKPILRACLSKRGRCVRHPMAGRAIHGGIDMAIETMWHPRLFVRRWPRGDDAEIVIDLHGIGIDDDAAYFPGKPKRQRRLAAGGRPCDKHGFNTVRTRIHPMSLVATLICNPANPALDSTVVDGARAILPDAGPAKWLFDEVAVDIPFAGSEDTAAIIKRLSEARGDLPIDIVVQPQIDRRKKLFLADMDSTMIGQECIDELADFAGLKAHVAGITERA